MPAIAKLLTSPAPFITFLSLHGERAARPQTFALFLSASQKKKLRLGQLQSNLRTWILALTSVGHALEIPLPCIWVKELSVVQVLPIWKFRLRSQLTPSSRRPLGLSGNNLGSPGNGEYGNEQQRGAGLWAQQCEKQGWTSEMKDAVG